MLGYIEALINNHKNRLEEASKRVNNINAVNYEKHFIEELEGLKDYYLREVKNGAKVIALEIEEELNLECALNELAEDRLQDLNLVNRELEELKNEIAIFLMEINKTWDHMLNINLEDEEGLKVFKNLQNEVRINKNILNLVVNLTK